MRSRLVVIMTAVLLVCCSFLYSPPAAGQAFIEELVARNEPAVLVIEGTRLDGTVTQSSGCVVSKEGLILTTAHQVDNIKQIQGRQSNGEIYTLSLVEMDTDRELALLQSDKPFPAAVAIGDARPLRAGATLVTIATPVNLDFSVATGIVANTSRTFRGFPVIQAELTAAAGSSGGPVFNQKGEVVGLIMGVLEAQNWATIVIPVNNAFSMLERHGLYSTLLPDNAAEQELMPVSGISEMELRALESYNKGTRTAAVAEKVRYYSRAVELIPEFYEAWFNLAVVLHNDGQLENARAAYKKAILLKRESIEARRNLGRLYMATEAYEDAVTVFREVVALLPQAPQSFNDLGEAYRKAGLYAKAVEAFQKALALDEQYANALYNLGMTQVQQSEWMPAYDAFERYLAAAPNADDKERVETWLTKIKEQIKQ